MLDVSPASRSPADLVALAPARAAAGRRASCEARRTLAQLGQMSDRELSDIGLLRADLADCTALPLDDDPSERLARARAIRAWYGHSHRDLAA